MYISSRATVVRNFAIAGINGSLTLIILLIAPLGIAAVISNTFLVTVASFFTATIADQIIRYLQPARTKEILASLNLPTSELSNSNLDSHDIDRR